jgi:hypothetical protein
MRGVGHRHERWGGLRWTRQRQARVLVLRAGFRERTSRVRRTALKRFRQIFGWPALGWLKFLAEEAAYGKTVWSWRPWLASSWRRFAKPNRAMRAVNSSATEARGIRLRGERGISRKTIVQGMPGCSGCTCMLVCAFLSASCTRDRGCQPAPGIPCALVSRKSVRMCERAVAHQPPVAGTEPVAPKSDRACVRARDSSGVFLNPNSCKGFEPEPGKEGSG